MSEIFKILIHGRNIVTEFVKLQYGIVKRMEVEVSGDHIGIHLISGVLNGCEVVNFVITRDNDHSSGMLRSCSLNIDTAVDQSLYLGSISGLAAFIEVLSHITVSGLIRNSTDSSCLEHVILTEEFFGILMYLALTVTRKVKVDIRRFIAIETKERFKGYLMGSPSGAGRSPSRIHRFQRIRNNGTCGRCNVVQED